MDAPRPFLIRRWLRSLATGLMVAVALLAIGTLAACNALEGQQAGADDPDACLSTADCEDPGRLATQVRLDTDAILAGMAHARAHMGMQEDAAP